MDKKIEEMLYRSFDENLNTKEREELSEALENYNEVRKEKKDIMLMRDKISKMSNVSFRTGFANRVMSVINSLDKENVNVIFYEAISSLFRPLAIAAAILIIAMVSYNLTQTDHVSIEDAFAVPEVSLQDAYDPLLAYNLE